MSMGLALQGYLTYKKTSPPRILPDVPRGVAFSYERGTPVWWMVPGDFATTGTERRGGCACKHGERSYRDASLTRKRKPLGPYRKPMLRVLEGSQGGGRFLLGEVPLHVKDTTG